MCGSFGFRFCEENKMEFHGFPKETIKFLFEIEYNNNREWYEAHKPDYQKFVLKPFQELVIVLGRKMLEIDPEFQIIPAVDKTISRIYRDIRFSKDKTPYRYNVWISFKRPVDYWKETPVYFFEIYPEYYHFGMGFFYYPAYIREELRNRILEDIKSFKKAVSFYRKGDPYEIAGGKFKRVKDTDVPEEIREWYERRDLYLYCRRELDDLIFKPELTDFLYNNFILAKPFYHYLWDTINRIRSKVKFHENRDD
jgi:uncharacterized protein (TIGR02453 family)